MSKDNPFAAKGNYMKRTTAEVAAASTKENKWGTAGLGRPATEEDINEHIRKRKEEMMERLRQSDAATQEPMTTPPHTLAAEAATRELGWEGAASPAAHDPTTFAGAWHKALTSDIKKNPEKVRVVKHQGNMMKQFLLSNLGSKPNDPKQAEIWKHEREQILSRPNKPTRRRASNRGERKTRKYGKRVQRQTRKLRRKSRKVSKTRKSRKHSKVQRKRRTRRRH